VERSLSDNGCGREGQAGFKPPHIYIGQTEPKAFTPFEAWLSGGAIPV